jgi:hypothetical protein
LNINNLSLASDNKDIYQFEGQDYKKNFFGEESNSAVMLNSLNFCFGQRERKVINSNLEGGPK